VVVLAVLTALLVLEILLSLPWRLQHDAPIMLYLAFLMDKFDYVPYRDFFDMNMPGAYLASLLIGRVSGYHDVGLRFIDLAILGAMMTVTFLWMRDLSRRAAWGGAVIFGLMYLRFGPETSLQREYLTLLPVATALWLLSFRGLKGWLRLSGVGLLFGLAATIKLQAAIGLLPVLVVEILDRRESRGLIMAAFASTLQVGLGFAVPFLALAVYLWRTGAMGAFVDISRNYWPLYAHLTGGHATIDGVERLRYLVARYREFGYQGVWFAPAAIGIFVAIFHSALTSQQKRLIMLVSLMALCYSIYQVLSGQFWSYHWLPFLYFVVQLSSLCFIDLRGATRQLRAFPIAVICLTVLASVGFPFQQLLGRPLAPPKSGRVDEIARYLSANLRPGDRVQPLDWTGGAVHAMLIAQAQLATPFVYDFHFYHHVSNPYIQGLRERFMKSLVAVRPRFIIQILGYDKPWVYGPDATDQFEDLQYILGRDYIPVLNRQDFIIYERKSGKSGTQY